MSACYVGSGALPHRLNKYALKRGSRIPIGTTDALTFQLPVVDAPVSAQERELKI